MKLTNSFNRFIYRVWAPFYDTLLDRPFFAPGRKRSMELLRSLDTSKILLVEVGTGVDLGLLPGGVSAVAFDLSPAMLRSARRRQASSPARTFLFLADAEHIPVASGSFDAALLNLVLSVVPDGAACLRETLRALQPGSHAVIFDKFVPQQGGISAARKLLSLGSWLLGTDITRRFSDLAHGLDCQVVHDEPSLLNGAYRVMLVRKLPPSFPG